VDVILVDDFGCIMNISIILNKLQKEKGLVLKDYREGTLRRRIQRRMLFDGAGSLEEYIRMIDDDYHLYWRLISDLFIGVTDFFRDKKVWETVKENVLPQVVEQRLRAKILSPLRIWSAGCSTGEETYSLAITVKEFFRENNIRMLPVYVYGTDIMEDKLREAKAGRYAGEKLKKVEPALRAKYFQTGQTANSEYRVHPDICQLTRFQRYDLVLDNRLRGFDLVVCRNVLIYFQKQLQEQVIGKFHQALRAGGHLWLGLTETLWGEGASLFAPVHKRERIYRKRIS